MPCTEANNFIPALPKEKVDIIYLWAYSGDRAYSGDSILNEKGGQSGIFRGQYTQ